MRTLVTHTHRDPVTTSRTGKAFSSQVRSVRIPACVDHAASSLTTSRPQDERKAHLFWSDKRLETAERSPLTCVGSRTCHGRDVGFRIRVMVCKRCRSLLFLYFPFRTPRAWPWRLHRQRTELASPPWLSMGKGATAVASCAIYGHQVQLRLSTFSWR